MFEHFNITRLLDSFVDQDAQILYMITEHAEGSDLARLVRGRAQGAIPEDSVWNYLIQAAQGLNYLHQKGVVHRDIKPENLYLDKDDNIKISADFCLTEVQSPAGQTIKYGQPLYQAPEVVSQGMYDEMADVWALGCVAYQLMCRVPPFNATGQAVLHHKIINRAPPPFPADTFSPELALLDPTHRLGLSHLLGCNAVRLRVQEQLLVRNDLRARREINQLEHKLREALSPELGHGSGALREENRCLAERLCSAEAEVARLTSMLETNKGRCSQGLEAVQDLAEVVSTKAESLAVWEARLIAEEQRLANLLLMLGLSWSTLDQALESMGPQMIVTEAADTQAQAAASPVASAKLVPSLNPEAEPLVTTLHTTQKPAAPVQHTWSNPAVTSSGVDPLPLPAMPTSASS
eukprot:gene5436-5443_t